jgi:5,10-methylenetetrahydromethanopterin reductase
MKNLNFRSDLGVIFHPSFPPETLADYARKAESAGFDELWLWDDCFLPGAFTSAALALSATQRLKVGIGLLPVKAYNPLFAAMEITTLARAFPGRFLPGFGYGVGTWMAQIGAAPKPSIRALQETVTVVRQLLGGEKVTTHSDHINLEKVQMQLTPAAVPSLYIGAMRERSLRLAGKLGDGTILTGMSSPAYVRWAMKQIRAGMAEAGCTHHRVVVYVDVKVNRDGVAARAAARQALAERLPWADVHTDSLGITKEAAAFFQKYSGGAGAGQIPDEWLDAFTASGTPGQVTEALQRWIEAGADTVIFQPLNGDAECLDEYIRELMPELIR